jgi:hypothetical protein
MDQYADDVQDEEDGTSEESAISALETISRICDQHLSGGSKAPAGEAPADDGKAKLKIMLMGRKP